MVVTAPTPKPAPARPARGLRNPRVVGAALIAALSLAAWLALWALESGPYGRYVSHHGVAGDGLPLVAAVAVFAGGWALMSAAMMLPSVHPLVSLFADMTRRRPERHGLLAALLGGYLLVWTLVGLLALAGDAGVHAAVGFSGLAPEHEWVIGAAVLAFAGAYQFSPLKDRCLDACRSPKLFLFTRWRGRRPVAEAFRLGVAHGGFCVGCCAGTMLVLFALGLGSLGAMFALAALTTVEKTASWGRALTAPVGFALLAAAAAMVMVELV